MKKRIVITAALALTLSAGVFAACDASASRTPDLPGGAGDHATIDTTLPSSESGEQTGYRLSFDSCGGTPVDAVNYAKHAYLVAPEEPTREGYRFDGWYLDEDFATPYDNSKPLMGDVTLYGKWVAAEIDDYWIYIETYSNNPLDYVYYWSTATNAKTVWSGEEAEIATKAPLAPKAADGTEIYRIKIQAEYEADKIIFHNGNGGYGDQTIDLDLPGQPTIYWVGEKAGTAWNHRYRTIL